MPDKRQHISIVKTDEISKQVAFIATTFDLTISGAVRLALSYTTDNLAVGGEELEKVKARVPSTVMKRGARQRSPAHSILPVIKEKLKALQPGESVVFDVPQGVPYVRLRSWVANTAAGMGWMTTGQAFGKDKTVPVYSTMHFTNDTMRLVRLR